MHIWLRDSLASQLLVVRAACVCTEGLKFLRREGKVQGRALDSANPFHKFGYLTCLVDEPSAAIARSAWPSPLRHSLERLAVISCGWCWADKVPVRFPTRAWQLLQRVSLRWKRITDVCQECRLVDLGIPADLCFTGKHTHNHRWSTTC